MPETEATADAFLGGLVTVFQPKTGFRAGTDSVLLAAALNDAQTGEACEFGCGAGGALFPAAWRLKNANFTGLERDPVMLDLARRGIAENGFGDRVQVADQDVATIPAGWENRFDLVFSNPPFFEAGKIKPPGEGRQGAYLESLPLKDWIGAMLYTLKPKGRFVMIHRASELARILSVIERRTGEITVMPVRSWPGADAKRVIVKARKGLRSGPMRLLSGLDIYQSRGGPRTALIDSIARSGGALDWGEKTNTSERSS
ncbi:tRNA1(Val) (adenine(37)-N6)-methyltransferase [Henriciella aquimarina]|uniref:tRNA1(Val) (adenine(37)-N6)-methyltransferase n=1 Tax=Henriciella aquimarina TaxID=545261 RepID=UPI000A03D3B4|nr:methyltransferase domain-containing protein [Henriciella aquimarina]